jgi:hypothetical protein
MAYNSFHWIQMNSKRNWTEFPKWFYDLTCENKFNECYVQLLTLLKETALRKRRLSHLLNKQLLLELSIFYFLSNKNSQFR